MNSSLAQYLFAQETLYKIGTKNEIVPQKLSKENGSEAAKATLEKPVEVASPEPMIFRMKTHHLIVVYAISENNRTFLSKILMALNLSYNKVDLLDFSTYKGSGFKEIIYNNAVKSILIFGEKAGGVFLQKLNLNKYQVKELKQINFLFTDELDIIETNNQNEKRLLWDALKQLY